MEKNNITKPGEPRMIVGLLIFILTTYLIGDKQNMFWKNK
jgi:hypothetical protein